MNKSVILCVVLMYTVTISAQTKKFTVGVEDVHYKPYSSVESAGYQVFLEMFWMHSPKKKDMNSNINRIP